MVSKVYFGVDGLTSTSANYVANLAKEYYKKFEGTIDATKFYKTVVSLIGSKEEMPISMGSTKEDLNKIPTMIKEIAECKSLIAWFREAIKAREFFRKALQSTTIHQWAESQGITLPTQPQMGDILSEEEYYASLPIKEMNRYYYLETLCAELGKYIHENGVLNTEKEVMVKKAAAPYSTSGTGRDMTVTRYILTCEHSEVESVYFSLQDQHRTYQAQLNSMKFECEKAVQKSMAEANAKYTEECAAYSTEMQKYQAQFREWKLQQDIEIQNLKIVIPDHLNGIYTKIKSLGK